MARVIPAAGQRLSLNPFPWLFHLLTSVRFAVLLVSAIAVAILAGVLVPQVPEFARDDPTTRALFLEQQADRFGPFAAPLRRLGFHELFRNGWFNFLLGVLVLAIAVCTCGRLPGTWRQVRHPQKHVSAAWFDSAHFRAVSSPPPDVAQIAAVLTRRHYHVETLLASGETRLYADRFRWSPLATFISHLALVIFLAGGIISWRLGQQVRVVIAEGTTAPVFALDDPAHMQVRATSIIHERDAAGRETDIATNLEVFKRGEVVAAGKSSINHPLRYDGFLFHQSALAENGAALQVRNATGATTYAETFALENQTAVPRVRAVADDGTVLLDGIVPPSFLLDTGLGGANLQLPGALGTYTLALRDDTSAPPGVMPFRLVVAAPTGELQETAVGEALQLPGVSLEFEGIERSIFAALEGVPGMEDGALVQLIDDGATSFLVLTSSTGETLRLAEGQPLQFGGNSYTFEGRRSFTGITIRKDPGAGIIWVATALLLFGLCVTFYLPRRRIWVRITGDQIKLAGLAERGSEFSAELQWICEDVRPRTPALPN